jgi:hypothetical protein
MFQIKRFLRFFFLLRFLKLETVFFLLTIIFLISCKKEPLQNIQVQPGDLDVFIKKNDTLILNAFSYKPDTVRSSNVVYGVLGNFNDPVFGMAEYKFASQWSLGDSSLNIVDTLDVVIDSAVFTLVVADVYNNHLTEGMSLHAMLETLYLDSAYFSNKQINYDPVAISKNVRYEYNSALKLYLLHFNIQNNYAKKILNSVKESNNKATFKENFKGVYLQSSATPLSGKGGVFTFDPFDKQSGLKIYYKEPNISSSQRIYIIKFDGTCQRINLSNFNHTVSGISTEFNNHEYGKSNLYVQGLGGVAIKIEFPNLNEFLLNKKIALNKAQLILKVKNETNDNLAPNLNLAILALNEAGTNNLVADFNFDGNYYADSNEYRFALTSHFTYLLNNLENGINKNFGFIIYPRSINNEVNRTIFEGTLTSPRRTKLILNYTEI